MLHSAPSSTSGSDRVPSRTEFDRTVTVREGLCFHIVLDAKADDPFSQAFAQGKYPASPLTELMFQMVRPGDRVLDLGAHIGTFSLAAAALGCQVVAVEASPRNAGLLHASVTHNGFANMRVVHAAVADRVGVADFIPNGPHGVLFTPAVDLPRVTVRALTVDRLLREIGWERVDFIKMDVEGSEIAALEGMAHLLAREDAPPILYECNGHTLRFFDRTAQELKRTLEKMGYRNYLIEPGQLTPVRARDLQPDAVVDYLAIKRWPSRLTGWRVRRRLPRTHLVERFLAACAHPHQHVRGHAARELETAPTWLVTDPAIQNALTALRNDAVAEVRDAAAWTLTYEPKSALERQITRALGQPPTQVIRAFRSYLKQRLAGWLGHSVEPESCGSQLYAPGS